jgi:O-antigen/teichoic acid export membrane protein
MSDDRRGSVARGAFWLTLGQTSRQVIAIGTNVALARILDPESFGLFAMSLVAAEVAQQFADFGIGSAIVQNRTIDRRAVSTCFWINVGLALLCAIVLAASSPWIGALLKHPMVGNLLILSAVNVIISGALTVPQALLVRDMRFQHIVTAQMVGSISGAVVAIVFASMGGGAWSLAVQPLVGTAVTLALMMVLARWRPQATFSYESVREMMHFSGNLLGHNVVTLIGRHAHNVIMGRSLASAAVGIYTMAQTVTYFPVYQISAVVVRLLFPTLSRLQDDLIMLRKVYLEAVALIALCTFPLMAGLFAVAPDFVPVVFGDQWVGVVPVLQVVLWLAMLQSVATTSGTVLLSLGKSRQMLGITLVGASVTIAVLLVTVRWGIMGVTWSLTTLGFMSYLYITWAALRHVGLGPRDFAAAVGRPLAASVLMAMIVMVLRAALDDLGAPLRLVVCILVGGLLYAGASYAINRRQSLEMIDLIKRAVGKRATA